MRERKKENAVIPAGVLMIDVKQVAAKCGLGVSTVWKLAKDESSGFPKPIRLNARCARWRYADIKAWVDQLTPEAA